MDGVDAREPDLAVTVPLAGDAVTAYVLAELDRRGHAGSRTRHGFVFQRLLVSEPTIGELAADLAVTQQAVSQLVAELEGLGQIERVGDPLDRRVRRIRLTERGRAVIEAARDIRRDLERRLEAAVGADDLAAARRTLDAVLELTGAARDVAERRARPPAD